MEYPEDLPENLRTYVEAAIARAEEGLFKSKKQYGAHFPTYWPGALLIWLRTVFFSFGEQSLKMGHSNAWSVERIRHELDSYLNSAAIGAFSRLAPPNCKLNDYLIQRQIDEIVESVKELEEWNDLQKQIKKLAEDNTNPLYGNLAPTVYRDYIGDLEDTESSSKQKRRYLQPNYELLKDSNGKLNRILAAEAIGTTPRNFSRIVGQGAIKGIGPKTRKQYRVKELLDYLEKKNLGQNRDN